MLQFLKIIFLNGWRGMRRANILPALVLMLASLSVLLVGSNAAASGTVHNATQAITHAADHVRQMTFGGAGTQSDPVTKATHPKKKHKSSAVADPADTSTTQTPSASAQPNQGAATPTNSLQLAAVQSNCQQGQIAYTVASAIFTLPTPTTADGTLEYYWETRIDSGTNSSGTPPISASQTSQDLPAGSTQVTLSNSQPQPLVSAPASTTYAYSFRLHVVVGPTDTVSDWVSVPQATSTACTQN